jgi:hypothetical protein
MTQGPGRFEPRRHPRVALLVDGDNLSPGLADAILCEAARFGDLTVRRVYGDMGRGAPWATASRFRTIHAGTGKNAADVLLAIDAVALSFAGGFDAFALASSDGDFSHLAHHLRERGFDVTGLGEAKAPPGFRAACSRFVMLGSAGAPNVDDLVAAEIRAHAGPDGLAIGQLGARLGARGVRVSLTPDRSWRRYLAARPGLYDCDPKGPAARVRLRAP